MDGEPLSRLCEEAARRKRDVESRIVTADSLSKQNLRPEFDERSSEIGCSVETPFYQEIARKIRLSLVGSEMCIRDRLWSEVLLA